MEIPNIDNNKKISRSIGIMYKLRPFVNVNTMKSVYYSIIYPHLIYGLQVWGSAFITDLEKMNIVQKKAVRMITSNDSYLSQGYGLCHTVSLFLKLEFLKISDIYNLQISNFIFDCLNGYAPSQFNSWFTLNSTIPDHHTRSNVQLQSNNVINTTNLFIPFARTTHYGKKSIKVYGPKIWNEIPNNIQAIKSKKGFLHKLKQYYIANYNCTN